MGILFTNKEFAEKFRISLTKVRRLAKDFLEPDPEATLQSGKARRFSENEAFDIYLGHHLITLMKFKIHEAQAILKEISPWMKKKGLYPEWERGFKPDIVTMYDDEHDEYGGSVFPTIIQISNANTESGFTYTALLDIETKNIKKNGRQYKRMEFIEETIIEPPKGKRLLVDELHVRVLYTQNLIWDFRKNISPELNI